MTISKPSTELMLSKLPTLQTSAVSELINPVLIVPPLCVMMVLMNHVKMLLNQPNTQLLSILTGHLSNHQTWSHKNHKIQSQQSLLKYQKNTYHSLPKSVCLIGINSDSDHQQEWTSTKRELPLTELQESPKTPHIKLNQNLETEFYLFSSNHGQPSLNQPMNSVLTI